MGLVMYWIGYIKDNGINIVCSALILSTGYVSANLIKRWLSRKILLKSKDPTAKLFVINVAYALLIIIVMISVLSRLGVPSASLLTVLGAGSLAIALSLKDSLSNVASGLILVSLKPFHLGDSVEINGVSGTLDQVNLLNIGIKTANGDYAVIPNSKVFSDKIYTKGVRGERRIDLTIGISYDANIKQAKTLINELLDQNKKVLSIPEPVVVVKELADSSVLLAVRPWVKKNDYSSVLFELTESIKLVLDANKISIPYPQLEAHISCSHPTVEK